MPTWLLEDLAARLGFVFCERIHNIVRLAIVTAIPVGL
jgi:hypothetical protein